MTSISFLPKPAFLPLAMACAFAAQAQTHSQPEPDRVAVLSDTVVTANRVHQPLSDVLADVTVIDEGEIARSGASTVADLLARQGGLELSRSGGIGTPTGIFLRGADSRFTAVYIDGVRVDTQATGGPP